MVFETFRGVSRNRRGPLVRPATGRDIPALVRAATTSIREEEDIGFGTPRSEQLFTDARRLSAAWQEPNIVHGEEVLVADLGGHVVGYVTIEDRGEDLELINIDVASEFQRRGIGTRLVRFVEDRARQEGKSAVTLGTSRNVAGVAWKSLPWWQALGYSVTGEEENEWTRAVGPGVREIRMRKDLRGGDVEGRTANQIRLRDVRDDDLPIFFDHQRDPIANRMAASTAKDPSDRGAFRAHWTRIRSDNTVTIKTILLGGHVIGSVASFLDKEFGKPEVTYWIGRECWGRGLATKALSEFLRLVTVRPLYARSAKDNIASIRVLEKCGFRRSSSGRGFANARGEEIDEVVLVLGATK